MLLSCFEFEFEFEVLAAAAADWKQMLLFRLVAPFELRLELRWLESSSLSECLVGKFNL